MKTPTNKAKAPAPAKAPSRDREATMHRFVEVAATVIARDGAAGLGVNAIAAEAGADKKLIDRYFGGPDGLLAALNDLTLRGDVMGSCAGLPLKTEQDWTRVMAAFDHLLSSAYGRAAAPVPSSLRPAKPKTGKRPAAEKPVTGKR